jgi:hypothetical protein
MPAIPQFRTADAANSVEAHFRPVDAALGALID